MTILIVIKIPSLILSCNLFYTFSAGIFEMASLVFCAFTLDRVGRKRLMGSFLLIAGVGLMCSVIILEVAEGNQSTVNLDFYTLLPFMNFFQIPLRNLISLRGNTIGFLNLDFYKLP